MSDEGMRITGEVAFESTHDGFETLCAQRRTAKQNSPNFHIAQTKLFLEFTDHDWATVERAEVG